MGLTGRSRPRTLGSNNLFRYPASGGLPRPSTPSSGLLKRRRDSFLRVLGPLFPDAGGTPRISAESSVDDGEKRGEARS